MSNEKDRQDRLRSYFSQDPQGNRRSQSRNQQDQTQWFSPEDDEDDADFLRLDVSYENDAVIA